MSKGLVTGDVVIRPKPPYLITPHIKMFTLPSRPTPCLYDNGCCRRLFRDIACEVCINGEPDDPLLYVRVFRGDAREARCIVEHVYNVHLNYNEFLEQVQEFPKLYEVAWMLRGIRPALTPSLFEALIKNIVSQNISQKLALKITSSLTELYGEKMDVGGKIFYDFPSPSKLAEVDINMLRRTGLSIRKATYIRDIARAVTDGFDLESLKRLEISEAIKELTKFKGVGPWTAKLSLMASTGNLSLDLLEDRSVARGVKSLGLETDDIGNVIEKCKRHAGLIMYLLALYYETNK